MATLLKAGNTCKRITFLCSNSIYRQVRYAATKETGAFLPEPKQVPFGIIRVFGAVIPGLLIGAAISKNIANFLEENDLFVPSDDDDDDD